MELLRAMILKLITEDESLLSLNSGIVDKINMKCVNALNEIRLIIIDDNLNDFECVEKIVSKFESIGSDGGNRHDF